MRVYCPICGKEIASLDKDKSNPHCPFGSETCRWIDLGRWFDGSYRMQVQDDADSSSEQADNSPESG